MNRSWTVGAWLVTALVAVPVVVVCAALFAPAAASWEHLRQTVLPGYVLNTVALAVLVGAFAAVLGVATAWTVATRQFPGRWLFSWGLMLPLAVPAYVVAYVYADLLEFAGPVQQSLRQALGWEGAVLPPIRSLGGAAVVLGFVLYPYVYLLARSAFASQARTLLEAARALGASRRRAFWLVALPAARPVVAGGVALAMMEAVADYGVVEHFGVPTFTTGILRTWFAAGDRQAALLLAACLFGLVAVLVLGERWARRGRFHNPVAPSLSVPLVRLRGWRAAAAIIAVATPLVLGFAVPVAVLGRHAIAVGDPLLGRGFADFAQASVGVASVTALLAVALALWLAYAERLRPHPATRLAVGIATLGYALPGAVLAVGVLVPLATMDRGLAQLLRDGFGWNAGLLLTGTATALVFACLARFLTAAYNACHGGLAQIHVHLDEAARSLGAGPRRVLRGVHVPLLRGAVASAALLVFIDVMKELPATLILRPFNFETLATRVYRLAADERLAEASTAALAIVAVGVVPAILLGVAERGRSPERGMG